MKNLIFLFILFFSITGYSQVKRDTLDHTKDDINHAIKKSLDSTYTADEVDDLLNAKQATLVSGTNIKTVNNESLLGSGNIAITGSGDLDSNVFATVYYTDTELLAKQATLVSGTNIKTINSESILGSGNITISGTVDTVAEDGIATKYYVQSAIGEADTINLGGGATGQILKKLSNTDYDFGWADATGGSEDTTHLVSFANVIGLQDTVDDLQEDIAGKEDALGFTPEDVSNKSIDTTLGASNTLYPSQNAVKTYVDNAIETVNNEGDPRVPYMWVYLALDTIPSLTSFTPVTDAEISTLTTSDVIGVNTYDVSYVSLITGGTDAEYRTKTGETWSNWVNTWQLLKAVDSAQVRFTSSDEYETALACTLIIGGEDEIFTVTTVAEVLPDAPTGFEAEGGTSDTEIPMTWTDAVGGIDSVRIYEGSTNDTTAMTWIASVVQGTEAYTRTGRTAETTYWYAVKSYDGSNESYFSNLDSATTTAGGGAELPTPFFELNYAIADSVVTYSAYGQTRLYSYTNNGFTFTETDTANGAAIVTDSAYNFQDTVVTLAVFLDDTSNVFNMKYGDMSIEYWAYVTSTVNGGSIFRKMWSPGYQFEIVSNDGYFPGLYIRNGSGDDMGANTVTYVSSIGGKWAHVVITVDRDAGVGFYVDSVLVRFDDRAGWTDLELLNVINGSYPTIGHTTMSLAALRLYNFVLTPAEVKARFEDGR